MTCEVIQFTAAAAAVRNRVLSPRQQRRAGRPPLPPPATETAKNSRLRLSRRDTWWAARNLTAFRRALMDWYSALDSAQHNEVAEAKSYPSGGEAEDRAMLVERWRIALTRQMLTPAPDQAAVAWKRAALAAGQWQYANAKITRERFEQSIADDVAWLAAHPTRKSIAATRRATAD